jgi:uncharacterized protein (DUF1697 family)
VALTSHIALLRAVNVGGRKLMMADLRDWAGGLGFQDVRTLLQSGNLLFRSDVVADAALEARLEAEAARAFGMAIDFIVRTADEWDQVIAANPYPQAAERDPGRLVVVALKAAPSPNAVAALRAWVPGRETIGAHGRELYIIYPDGQGESKLTNLAIERRLGLRGTARNWNTVLKLAALASA